MTIDECKKYLPNRWAEIIQQDPLLMEIFEEHDYDLEYRLFCFRSCAVEISNICALFLLSMGKLD